MRNYFVLAIAIFLAGSRGLLAERLPTAQVCISADALTQLMQDRSGTGRLRNAKHEIELHLAIPGKSTALRRVLRLQTRNRVNEGEAKSTATPETPKTMHAFVRLHRLNERELLAGNCALTDEAGHEIVDTEIAKCISYLVTNQKLVDGGAIVSWPTDSKPLGSGWIDSGGSHQRFVFRCDNVKFRKSNGTLQLEFDGRIWHLIATVTENEPDVLKVSEYPLKATFDLRMEKGQLTIESRKISLELGQEGQKNIQKFFDSLAAEFNQAVKSMSADLGMSDFQIDVQEHNGRAFLVVSDSEAIPLATLARDQRQQSLVVYFSEDFLNRALAKYLTSPEVDKFRLVVLPTKSVERRDVFEVMSVKNLVGGKTEETPVCTLPRGQATDQQKLAVESQGLQLKLHPLADKSYDQIVFTGSILAVLEDSPVISVQNLKLAFRIWETNEDGGGFKIEGEDHDSNANDGLKVVFIDPRIPPTDRNRNRIKQLIDGLFGLTGLISEADPIPSLNSFATPQLHFAGWRQAVQWKNAGGRVVEWRGQSGLLLYGDLKQ